MKYLCLIYDDEKKWETMSKAEADAYMGEYFAFTDCDQDQRPLHRRRSTAAGADGDDGASRATASCPRPMDRLPRRRSSSAATISLKPGI